MDLEALRFANFSLLNDAVDDWATLVDGLEELERDANKGLRGAANSASWAGVNATVSKEFIGKTAGEFHDAHSQAKSIHRILLDTRDELKRHHRRLNDAIERGMKKNLTVTPTGDGGFTVRMNIHPDRAGKGTDLPDHSEGDVSALRDEIQRILDDATESDTSASKVLKAIADQSTYGFTDARYKDRDSAVAAVEKADELSKLAKKDPQDLSVKEFDALHSGLKKYTNDPLFSERFATKLGAKGTLDFWAGINEPGVNPDLNDSRQSKFGDFQKYLSLTLASATQSDSAGMVDWTRQMVDQASQPVRTNSGPLGFQVMSNLMRWGNYDDAFLHTYGSALMDTEKKLTGNGEGSAWRRTPNSPYLNRTGSDTGWDPMAGFMKGLSNSPAAATSFFNDTFISKGDESNSFERENENGKMEKATLSNFQYLFEERDWPVETNAKGGDSQTGRDNFALALEAATTGHPAGESPTRDTPAHNTGQAELVQSIVSSISQDPQRLSSHGFMSDSIGQIAAEYMPDIHRAMHPGDSNENGLFPVAGAAASLSEHDVTRFLYTVGRDPAGYAAVNLGQHSYTTSMMEYHFRNPDAYIEDNSFPRQENLKRGIENIASVAGEIEGTIGAGRAYEGELEAGARDSDYNAALEHAKTWGGTAVGIGIGLGTAPFVGPGGVVIGGVAGTAADEIIDAIVKGEMKNNAGDVIYRNGEDMQGTKESTYHLVEEAAKKAGDRAGNSSPHIISVAASAAETGFSHAKTNVNDAFDGQGVPRQLDEED
ncbi:hypothetical protein ACFWZT_11165 [Streptomyces alboflavus]|uniref:hypothetical protein n=1 Tax=Streptomyces alboflavus TaxID=67267 RepID=UPI0036768639